jgi:phage terminase large subunit GpA-like protein
VLHKCANPACHNPFRKLSQGKLFLVETEPVEGAKQVRCKTKSSHHIEYYWLCDQCAFALTLSFEKGRGVVTVPRPQLATNRLPTAPRAAEIPSAQSHIEEQAR